MELAKFNGVNIKRQSNFELLRVLAMIMIVAHHYVLNGSLEYSSLTLNSSILKFVSIGGKIGVDIFVLISGYFLVNSGMKKIKLFKLFMQVEFWGVVTSIFFGLYLFSINFIGYKDLAVSFVKSVFWIKTSFWFARVYLFLYILHPFINLVIKNINKGQHLKLIIFLLFIWSVLPKIEFSTIGELDWFVLLYLISAYTKLYCGERFKHTKKLCIIAVVLYIVVFISAIFLEIVGLKIPFIATESMTMASMESPFILIISYCIFVAFRNINFYSKIINKIASATFGVYLIHTSGVSRIFFWKYLFDNKGYANSNFLILHIIVSVALVYIICTVLELLRIRYIEPVYMNYFQSKKDGYLKLVNNAKSILKEKI